MESVCVLRDCFHRILLRKQQDKRNAGQMPGVSWK